MIEWFSHLAYKLELSDQLAGVHNIFHVSMLQNHGMIKEHEVVMDFRDLDIQPSKTCEDS